MLRTREELKTLKWIFIIVFIAVIIIAVSIKAFNAAQDKKMHDIVQKYARNGVLIYGADDSAPPLRYRDVDGQYKGVVVDFVNVLSVELGVEIKCKPYVWEDALKNIKRGETDMCDMFANEERAKYLVFTDPLYTLRTMLVCRKDNEYKLNDINSLTVATQKGDYANWYLRKNYPRANLVYVSNVGEGIDLLLKKKVDAVIGDEPVVQFYAHQKNVGEKIASVNTALYEEEVVLALPKSKVELVKPLNKAIARIREKGHSESIQQKWFGISTPLKQDTIPGEAILRYIIIAVILAVLAVLFKFIENKSLRVKVKQRTWQLEQRTNELNLMLNEMPEGVIVIDEKKKIISYNEPAATLVKKSKDERKGWTSEQYFGLLDINLDKEIYFDLKGDESKNLKINCGNEVLEINVFGIGGANIAARNIMFTIKDITMEVIKTNQLLHSSKMIAIGQLAAGMAHELRNPLGIIRTHSYILGKNENLDDETRIALSYIEESVHHAGGIIDNVMNFWRMTDENLRDINIKNFILSIISLNEEDIRKKEIDIQVGCDEFLILHSSLESLKHILMNIIQNAIDAVEQSKGKIYISAVKDSGNVVIVCHDNGTGIKEEDLGSLYNPFFTTKPPGKGTGLGLFVVYTEMEKLGGKIWVDSKPGKGTSFTMTVPDEERKEQEHE